MKKFFTFAITALAMVAVFSSCKNETLTDDALINNIATNVVYEGKCTWDYADKTEPSESEKVVVKFTKTEIGGLIAVVAFESGNLNGEGPWNVKNAVLTLSWKGYIEKVAYDLSLSGTINGNGDKFTLSYTNSKGDVTTMDLKKK